MITVCGGLCHRCKSWRS